MAEHLASIFGTEKDRVNCPFYFKIGQVQLLAADAHRCEDLIPYSNVCFVDLQGLQARRQVLKAAQQADH